MYNAQQYRFSHITDNTSTVVFSGQGTLSSVTVNSAGTGGTVTITDLASPVAIVGIITLNTFLVTTLKYDVSIAGGLRIACSSSPSTADITIAYTQ